MTETRVETSPTIDPPEIIVTEKTRIACDGGGGALGHPRVFLTMGADGRVSCPYCDRLYLSPAAAAASGRA